jgi:hypothetical protein
MLPTEEFNIDVTNPTGDVGYAFSVPSDPTSSWNQSLERDLFQFIGRTGGGEVIRYVANQTAGKVICVHFHVDESGNTEELNQWVGLVVGIQRTSPSQLYDPPEHTEIDHELTIHGIPFSIHDVNNHRDPSPRFHTPLPKVVETDTGYTTVYRTNPSHGMRVAGDLPECVYGTKEIPDHIRERVAEDELPITD